MNHLVNVKNKVFKEPGRKLHVPVSHSTNLELDFRWLANVAVFQQAMMNYIPQELCQTQFYKVNKERLYFWSMRGVNQRNLNRRLSEIVENNGYGGVVSMDGINQDMLQLKINTARAMYNYEE